MMRQQLGNSTRGDDVDLCEPTALFMLRKSDEQASPIAANRFLP
jgi:hypothetical protein